MSQKIMSRLLQFVPRCLFLSNTALYFQQAKERETDTKKKIRWLRAKLELFVFLGYNQEGE